MYNLNHEESSPLYSTFLPYQAEMQNNQDKNTYVKKQITNTLLELLKERELSENFSIFQSYIP